MRLAFSVAGVPQPKGSLRGFAFHRKGGKRRGFAFHRKLQVRVGEFHKCGKRLGVAMVESNAAVKPWMREVADAARRAQALPPTYPVSLPVDVELVFTLQRPKGHHVAGDRARPVKASAPRYPAGRPDVDKLARCVLDALTGVVWVDDAQVVELRASKRYGTPGLEARITTDVGRLGRCEHHGEDEIEGRPLTESDVEEDTP